MGWVDVPRAFQHMVQSVVESLTWRFPEVFMDKSGLKRLINNYLDDIFAASYNIWHGAVQHVIFLALCRFLGLGLSTKKGEIWDPSRDILGVQNDLRKKEVDVGESAKETLLLLIGDIWSHNYAPLKHCEKIAGNCEWIGGIIPQVRKEARRFHDLIKLLNQQGLSGISLGRYEHAKRLKVASERIVTALDKAAPIPTNLFTETLPLS